MATITPNQEAYLDFIAPGAFNSGHLATLEALEAGETTLISLGSEIGQVALDGFKDCTVILGEDPESEQLHVIAISL